MLHANDDCIDATDAYAARVVAWYRQAARYRSLSRLLGEEPHSGPLATLAREIEAQIQSLDALVTEMNPQRRRTQVLLAELDTVLMRARTRLDEGSPDQEHRHVTVEDLQEASRLCAEEARSTDDFAMKGLVAARAVALAEMAKIDGLFQARAGWIREQR